MGKYTSLGTACQITSQDMSPLVACLLLMLFTVGNSAPSDIINGCTAKEGTCTKKAEETTSVSPDLDHTGNPRSRRQFDDECVKEYYLYSPEFQHVCIYE